MSWLVQLLALLRREKEHGRLIEVITSLAVLGFVAHLVLGDVLQLR
jgi:hypothetical protein